MADGQPRDAGAVDDLARRERREARPHLRDLPGGPGRVRAAQPPARGGRVGRRLLRRVGRCRFRAPSSSATRRSGATRRSRSWRKLKPAFVQGGTVTAGNSSPLNDGAGALLIADEEGARGGRASSRSRGWSAARRRRRSTRTCSGSPPCAPPNIALERAGISWDDVAVVELNEAFASQCLADMARMEGTRPRQGQSQRRRDRDRAPARGLGRADPRLRSPTS